MCRDMDMDMDRSKNDALEELHATSKDMDMDFDDVKFPDMEIEKDPLERELFDSMERDTREIFERLSSEDRREILNEMKKGKITIEDAREIAKERI